MLWILDEIERRVEAVRRRLHAAWVVLQLWMLCYLDPERMAWIRERVRRPA